MLTREKKIHMRERRKRYKNQKPEAILVPSQAINGYEFFIYPILFFDGHADIFFFIVISV